MGVARRRLKLWYRDRDAPPFTQSAQRSLRHADLPILPGWSCPRTVRRHCRFRAEDLTFHIGCVGGLDGKPVVMVVPTWCGPPEEGETRVAPFLKLGTLLAGAIDVTSYGVSLSLFDPYIVNGQRVFMETCWVPALDTGSIDIFIQAMETAVSPACAVFTHEFKGCRRPSARRGDGVRSSPRPCARRDQIGRASCRERVLELG